MELALKTEINQFKKELDQFVDSVLKLNAARHQVRMHQLQSQHDRRIEKLLFQSWLSPYQSVEKWFDAQSDTAKEYWNGFYLKYQYDPEQQTPCLSELDFIHKQVFVLLRAKDLYVQTTTFSSVKRLMSKAV